MTDTVAVALIGQIGIFAAVVFNGILNHNRSIEAREGLHRQNEQLQDMANVGTETRTLVNSATRRLLNNVAVLSRRMYEANPTPENLESANAAEKALFDHDMNQVILDGPEGKQGGG